MFTDKELSNIYDNLPEGGKDMPKQDFIKQVQDLTDPAGMQRDAMQMVMGRQGPGIGSN